MNIYSQLILGKRNKDDSLENSLEIFSTNAGKTRHTHPKETNKQTNKYTDLKTFIKIIWNESKT